MRVDEWMSFKVTHRSAVFLAAVFLLLCLLGCQATAPSAGSAPVPEHTAETTPEERHAPTSVPTLVPLLHEDTLRNRWLEDNQCRPPCWEGLLPGKTTFVEAIELLEKNPILGGRVFTETAPTHDLKFVQTALRYLDQQGRTQETFVSVSFDATDENPPITDLQVSFAPVPLGKAIGAYGTPTHVLAYTRQDPHDAQAADYWVVEIVWMSRGLAMHTSGQGAPPMLDETFLAGELTIYCALPAQGCGAIQRPGTARYLPAWQGYRPFETYALPFPLPGNE